MSDNTITQVGVRAREMDAICALQSVQYDSAMAFATACAAGVTSSLDATTHFVRDELKRDTSLPIQRRTIEYPDEHAKTDSYDTILSTFKDDPWSTEVCV